MLLAINCNNTNIKFGVVDGDRIVGEWRQHTSAMRTADEYAVWLYELMRMEGIDPKSITDAIIGSVVPQANFNLRRLCTRYFSIASRCSSASPTSIYGIKIKGVGAGADRICNTVGREPDVPPDAADRRRLRHAPPTSTSSTRRAATAAASSRPAPSSPSRPWSTPRRCCRASWSRSRRR